MPLLNLKRVLIRWSDASFEFSYDRRVRTFRTTGFVCRDLLLSTDVTVRLLGADTVKVEYMAEVKKEKLWKLISSFI
ncbi:hypothetical protein ATZ36_12170 [Candidatus Endomicrobiellum trichonymphae]|jgi:hypothetical protein|uniref:Uncharacterized protein n=1 Tax=Endomicrobium trichonymphae TaxID=1408204 RepID=A0A1E5IP27_ENDTX|nr:hypothetical protein ATZ36_12170 [Candidatus Endomicrobium trichonymphae]